MSHLHSSSASAGHKQSSSNCSRVCRAGIRAWQLSPCPLMFSSRLPLILSSLVFAIPLSFASADTTGTLGCLCCFITAHIHLHMPSVTSVLVTLLSPEDMLPAAVPCHPVCLGDHCGNHSCPSPACRQEDHTKRDEQGLLQSGRPTLVGEKG